MSEIRLKALASGTKDILLEINLTPTTSGWPFQPTIMIMISIGVTVRIKIRPVGGLTAVPRLI